MKNLITISALVGAMWIAGCAGEADSRSARPRGRHTCPAALGPNSGGIDPVTLAGIEQARAAQEAANTASAIQAGIDAGNAANLAATQAAESAAIIAAAQASANAASQ